MADKIGAPPMMKHVVGITYRIKVDDAGKIITVSSSKESGKWRFAAMLAVESGPILQQYTGTEQGAWEQAESWWADMQPKEKTREG